MTRFKWKLVSVHLDVVQILTQDRCMVCAERAIGLENIFAHPMELLGDMGLVESCFGVFGDSVSVGARKMQCLHQRIIGSEIISDTPDGTPR